MTPHALDGHLGTSVTVDLCAGCQAFWFDGRESLQLSPGATLRLFRIIGEHSARRRGALAEGALCPTCAAPLVITHDRQRSTAFQYRRCPQAHGRLQTFFDFLRQKDFIRPLSKAQIEELRRNIQIVNCSNCGAPIDLNAASACAHCASPVSMLDMAQAKELIAQLQEADGPGRPIDPTLPLRVAKAKREAEAAFASFPRDPHWLEDVASGGLVGAGLVALARWLSQDV